MSTDVIDFWSFPEEGYRLDQTIQEFASFIDRFGCLRLGMQVAIYPGAKTFSVMPEQIPEIALTATQQAAPEDSKIKVSIVQGAPKSDVVNGLRRAADLLDKYWEQLTDQMQCEADFDWPPSQ